MKTELDDIRASVERIESILLHRWWLFGLMGLTATASLVALYVDVTSGMRVERLAISNEVKSTRNEIAIDSAMKQQIIYQQQLAQYWDRLAEKNPKIKVPRVIVRPPSSPINHATPTPTPTETPIVAQPLTDAELTRNNTPSKVVKTDRRRRSTATPLPWWKRLGGNTR